jgi:hypothetical protein
MPGICGFGAYSNPETGAMLLGIMAETPVKISPLSSRGWIEQG